MAENLGDTQATSVNDQKVHSPEFNELCDEYATKRLNSKFWSVGLSANLALLLVLGFSVNLICTNTDVSTGFKSKTTAPRDKTLENGWKTVEYTLKDGTKCHKKVKE